MKRYHFLIALLSSAAAQADFIVSKYYIELAAGASSMFSDAQGKTDFNPNFNPQIAYPAAGGPVIASYDVTNMGSSWGNLSPIGALRLGFDWRIKESLIVLGAYVNGGASGAHAANRYTRIVTSNFASVESPGYAYVWERGFVGAGLRFGVTLSERSLLYATLGWSIRNTSVRFGGLTTYMPPVAPQTEDVPLNVINSQNVNRTRREWINCLVTGLGIDVNLNQNWILGLFCEVNIGSRQSFNFGDNTFTLGTGAYDHLSFKVRPTISQAFVTLKYALPVSTCEEPRREVAVKPEEKCEPTLPPCLPALIPEEPSILTKP